MFLREKSNETISHRGQFDVVVYTDGSAEAGVRNGGAGWNITEWGGRVREEKAPAGALCSSYICEVTAMSKACDSMQDTVGQDILILTDSKALVTCLTKGRPDRKGGMEELRTKLIEVRRRNNRLAIQWIPSHCGTPGNERADDLANQARCLPQEEVPVWFEAAKGEIRREVCVGPVKSERFRKIYSWKATRTKHSRQWQATVAQLRSGHCPTDPYYSHRIGKTDSNLCDDCGEAWCKDHWWRCDRWRATRERMNIHDESFLNDDDRVIEFLEKSHPQWLK